jgi:hypothetical protein
MQSLKLIEPETTAAGELHGPRADLARAIAAREAAAERAEAARAPLRRLDALLAQEAEAREKVAQLGAANAAAVERWAREELTEWARGGAAAIALSPNDDLASAKLALAEAERLGDAARAARPALKAEADDAFREFRIAGDSVNELIRAVLYAEADAIRAEQVEHERGAADCVERLLALRAAFKALQLPNESPSAAQVYVTRVRPWTSVARSRAEANPDRIPAAREKAAVDFAGRLGNEAGATLEDAK